MVRGEEEEEEEEDEGGGEADAAERVSAGATSSSRMNASPVNHDASKATVRIARARRRANAARDERVGLRVTFESIFFLRWTSSTR